MSLRRPLLPSALNQPTPTAPSVTDRLVASVLSGTKPTLASDFYISKSRNEQDMESQMQCILRERDTARTNYHRRAALVARLAQARTQAVEHAAERLLADVAAECVQMAQVTEKRVGCVLQRRSCERRAAVHDMARQLALSTAAQVVSSGHRAVLGGKVGVRAVFNNADSVSRSYCLGTADTSLSLPTPVPAPAPPTTAITMYPQSSSSSSSEPSAPSASPLVLVLGPPLSGKTALAAALTAHATTVLPGVPVHLVSAESLCSAGRLLHGLLRACPRHDRPLREWVRALAASTAGARGVAPAFREMEEESESGILADINGLTLLINSNTSFNPSEHIIGSDSNLAIRVLAAIVRAGAVAPAGALVVVDGVIESSDDMQYLDTLLAPPPSPVPLSPDLAPFTAPTPAPAGSCAHAVLFIDGSIADTALRGNGILVETSYDGAPLLSHAVLSPGGAGTGALAPAPPRLLGELVRWSECRAGLLAYWRQQAEAATSPRVIMTDMLPVDVVLAPTGAAAAQTGAAAAAAWLQVAAALPVLGIDLHAVDESDYATMTSEEEDECLSLPPSPRTTAPAPAPATAAGAAGAARPGQPPGKRPPVPLPEPVVEHLRALPAGSAYLAQQLALATGVGARLAGAARRAWETALEVENSLMTEAAETAYRVINAFPHLDATVDDAARGAVAALRGLPPHPALVPDMSVVVGAAYNTALESVNQAIAALVVEEGASPAPSRAPARAPAPASPAHSPAAATAAAALAAELVAAEVAATRERIWLAILPVLIECGAVAGLDSRGRPVESKEAECVYDLCVTGQMTVKQAAKTTTPAQLAAAQLTALPDQLTAMPLAPPAPAAPRVWPATTVAAVRDMAAFGAQRCAYASSLAQAWVESLDAALASSRRAPARARDVLAGAWRTSVGVLFRVVAETVQGLRAEPLPTMSDILTQRFVYSSPEPRPSAPPPPPPLPQNTFDFDTLFS